MEKLKILFAVTIILLFTCCADSKTFEKADGTKFTAEPYGWMNTSRKIEGVKYDINAGNLVWSILLSETLVVPVLLTGEAFYEPVAYEEVEGN